MRRAQIELAMSRIHVFHKLPIPGRRFVIADYVKSEYGIALLLDQHVNRPAHVPETLLQAADLFVEATQKGDPATWTSDDEAMVLAIYLSFRTATNMTESQKRAERTLEAVKAGILSDKRGSFVL